MKLKTPRASGARKPKSVRIDKADLVEAWSVLENLAVSLDQIGGAIDDRADQQQALDDYLTPELAQAINRARMRLAQYLSDAEAEWLSENSIPYWNYKGIKNGKHTRRNRT
jgi:hypothetical protein